MECNRKPSRSPSATQAQLVLNSYSLLQAGLRAHTPEQSLSYHQRLPMRCTVAYCWLSRVYRCGGSVGLTQKKSTPNFPFNFKDNSP
jgi:hypothetical protein